MAGAMMQTKQDPNTQLVQLAQDDFPLDMYQGYAVMPADRKGGLCETGMDRWGAEWHRYGTIGIPFTCAAPGSPLVLAPSQEFTMFNAGTDESGSGIPWPLSFAETDLAKSGAPVKEGFQYMIRTIAVQVGDPYVITSTGSPAVYTKNYDPWIDSYKERLRRAVYQNLAVTISFVDGPCEWIAGLITQYTPTGGLMGSTNSNSGAGIGLQQLYPLKKPVLAGARDNVDQVNFLLNSPNAGISLASDAANPTPLTTSALTVPVQLTAYGTRVKICDADCVIMVLNQLSQQAASQISQLQAPG